MINADAEKGAFLWNRDLGFEGIDSFEKCISDGISSFVDCGVFKKAELAIKSESFEIELPMKPAPIEYFKEKM